MGSKQDDANLILRLYEMRREEKMREARRWFDVEFEPRSAQDIIELLGQRFEDTAKFRMVLTYWDMVAALVKHGALEASLVHATNVEHVRSYAKLAPFMDDVRKVTGPDFLSGLEALVKTVPNYAGQLERWGKVSKGWHAKALETSGDQSGV